jgi:uncharacterized protein (DUF1778 family)
MPVTTATKQSRVELRTTDSVKELLSSAASLNGTDMTSFILACATEKARQIVKDHNNISLSHQAQLNLLKALKSPDKPTVAMKKLMALQNIEKY